MKLSALNREFFLQAVVFLVCVASLFYRLGSSPIHIWDEARYANNAIDMYLDHDPWVVHFLGEPDLYNTKPPLVLWMQSLSMQIFGISEFSVRLPSAIAVSFIMLLLLWFSNTVLKSWAIGVFSILAMAFSPALNGVHGARSGDLDAMLAFWISAYSFLYIIYLVNPARDYLYFLMISISVSAAFLTKGIAGFFMIPFLMIITILDGKLLYVMKKPAFYLAVLVVFTLCGGYYFLREKLVPGYWMTVKTSELDRFLKTVMWWQVHDFDYYVRNLFRERFTPFIYLLPAGVLFFFRKNLPGERKRVFAYLLIIVAGFLLMISYPEVKLEWYDVPVIPFLAFMFGMILFEILRMADQWIETKIILHPLQLIVVLALFSFPVLSIWKRINSPDHLRLSWDTTKVDPVRIDGAFVKHLSEEYPELNQYSIVKSAPWHIAHLDQLNFYRRKFALERGYKTTLILDWKNFREGDLVVCCEPVLKDSLLSFYGLQELYAWEGCSLFMVEQPF